MAVIKEAETPASSTSERPEHSEHERLVSIAHSWLLNTKGCSFAFAELVTYASETPDAIGWRGSSSVTMLVECKATRADFLADRKKVFRRDPVRGMGSYRFYMCPEGLISAAELPDRWGLVYVKPNGRARQIVGPKGNCYRPSDPFRFKDKNINGERIMMSSALRRLHLRGVMPMIYEAS